MSSYFSSYFIEPVVRHARRFSSQGSASSPLQQGQGNPHAQAQSHVRASSSSGSTTGASIASSSGEHHVGLSEGHRGEQHEALLTADDHAVAVADTASPAAVGTGGRPFACCTPSEVTQLATSTGLSPHNQLPTTTTTLPTPAPMLTTLPNVFEADDSLLVPSTVPANNAALEPIDISRPTNTSDTLMNDNSTASHPIPIPPAPEIDLPDITTDIPLAASAPTPVTPVDMRMSRTSSARDIPRPLMSMREDSPLLAGRSLPADDGMRSLRQQIHSIRELDVSQVEKARRMHELMTEEWRGHAATHVDLRPQSPASITSQEHAYIGNGASHLAPSSPLSATATGPVSPQSLGSRSSPVAPAPVILDPTNPFNVYPEDLKPSYRPILDTEHNRSSSDDSIDEHGSADPPEPVLGCKHYKRNVKIQCFDCKTWHSCRHCHDAAVSSHHLNRRKTENMLCMLCGTAQPAGQDCRQCGERAAYYYCDICKLWDDDAEKRIYHCADCGICRRGEGLGKDFVHCKKCNVCISIAHSSTHTCIENATDSNCPLCLDYMFTSALEIVAMPCGHYLHHHCYTSLMLSTYQCPICKRSAVNMETQWRKLEEEIRHQPMPREWADVKVEVKCNDCAGISVAPYHWLGVKCNRCDGFNTVQIRLLAGEDVRRDVQDFAEQRRDTVRRGAETSSGGREPIRRTFTAPVHVRPYFLEADHLANNNPSGRPLSARGFPDFDWPEFRGRFPGVQFPNMPGMPAMPGFPTFPFDVLNSVGRSLSPIRHYFDEQIVDGVPRQLRAGYDNGRVGSRRDSMEGDDGWFGEEAVESGSSEGEYDDEEEEDDDEEFDEEDSDEEMEDVGMEDEEEDRKGQRAGILDLELLGHR